MTYTTERVPGAHKHILSDICVKDSSGKVVLLAKHSYTFSLNYSIVDGDGIEFGSIKSERGLRSLTFVAEDANHVPLGKVIVQVQSQTFGMPRLAKIWMEDTSGQKLFDVQYLAGLVRFTGVKEDGSKIFNGSLSQGLGLKQELASLVHRNYTINVYDASFSSIALVSVIAALDSIPISFGMFFSSSPKKLSMDSS